jgi:hypothetical protein
VKQTIKRAVRNVQEQTLEDFIFGNPAQISLLGIQFQWTADTQAALTAAKSDKTIMSKNMKKVGAQCMSALKCDVHSTSCGGDSRDCQLLLLPLVCTTSHCRTFFARPLHQLCCAPAPTQTGGRHPA